MQKTGQLGEMLARAILDNLYRFVVSAVAGPARLVPLAALETGKIRASAFRVAAARGRLQATRGPDGRWRSSRNWVDEYLASRHRRREYASAYMIRSVDEPAGDAGVLAELDLDSWD